MTNSVDQLSPPSGFLGQVGRLFASRWFALVAVVIALLLTHRAIHNGLNLDDYFHRAVLHGSDRFGKDMPGPQGMFRFLPGNPDVNRELMDTGFLPWWSDPNIKAEFFQLIPTQTHILDYWLWPDQPELMHVHSLAWFALLVFVVAMFYRRFLGPTWMAGLAALLFAVEDAHGIPVAWICNRNVLIAASFGVGSVMAHDVWRREGKRWAFWLAQALWALSLLSKEAGIATCGYLFAYALWLDDSKLWQRFLTLVPYGIVLVVWRVVRDSLGFGVANLGFYVDPVSEPGRFVTELVARYPVFLFGQWVGFSDVAIVFPDLLGSSLWWLSVAVVGLLGLLFWPVLRRDRTARFFATGMLLAVIPICATIPNDRLLMFVGIGAFGLLVRFWHATFAADGLRPKLAPWRMIAVTVAVLLGLTHLVASPLLLPARVKAMTLVQSLYITEPFEETIKTQDLVVVNSPVPMCASYCMLQHDLKGLPSPRAVRTLAPGMNPVVVRRTDLHTIEVEPEGGYLVLLDRLFRNKGNPLKFGQKIQVARMTATVLSVEDGRPKNVAFRFETPLEDESLRWLVFRDGRYVPWTPPKVGEEVTVRSEWNPALDW